MHNSSKGVQHPSQVRFFQSFSWSNHLAWSGNSREAPVQWSSSRSIWRPPRAPRCWHSSPPGAPSPPWPWWAAGRRPWPSSRVRASQRWCCRSWNQKWWPRHRQNKTSFLRQVAFLPATWNFATNEVWRCLKVFLVPKVKRDVKTNPFPCLAKTPSGPSSWFGTSGDPNSPGHRYGPRSMTAWRPQHPRQISQKSRRFRRV